MPKLKKQPKKACKPKVVENLAFGALARAMFVERKKYTLRMDWDLFNADSIVNMYCIVNNIAEHKALPLKMLYMIYKGDLIIAIRNNLINGLQKFRIRIESVAKHLDFPDDRSQDISSTYFKDFGDKPIEYNVFMQGKSVGKYTFKRDGVFDTQWEGITNEWNRFLAGEGTDRHQVYKADAYLECDSEFLSPLLERDFHRTKKRLDLELEAQLKGVA